MNQENLAGNDLLTVIPIAYIHTDFKEKFGVPRQSGRVPELRGRIVFEKEYRNKEALRGIEGYSHLWLLWGFSLEKHDKWSPTVRPPRLGGNKRVGVFATRSPNRPNPIGLSCVRLAGIEETEQYGSVLIVEGADLVDGTPIYDIKPYLPYADAVPEALGGFAEEHRDDFLTVDLPNELSSLLPKEKLPALIGILRDDPRPSYQSDKRTYGLFFAGFEISFFVSDSILHVTDIKKST